MSEQTNPRVASNCRSCGRPREGNIKPTFLGFQKIKYQSCGADNLYPLTKNYLIIYGIAIVLVTAFCVGILLRGDIPIPGVLFFAGAYGLWRDRQIYQDVAATAARRTDE